MRGHRQMLCAVDPREATGADVNDHLAGIGQRFRRRHHRQIPPDEPGEPRLLTEDQAPNIRVQPVGADHDVEPTRRCMLECHLAVGGDGRDRVAEQILDLVAAGFVVDLAKVVAHDLHVPIRRGTNDLGEIDPCRTVPALAIQPQRVCSGGERLDARQDAHLRRDLHRRPEQIDGVAAGFA